MPAKNRETYMHVCMCVQVGEFVCVWGWVRVCVIKESGMTEKGEVQLNWLECICSQNKVKGSNPYLRKTNWFVYFCSTVPGEVEKNRTPKMFTLEFHFVSGTPTYPTKFAPCNSLFRFKWQCQHVP